jgi:bifunctional DNase/RNase
MTIEGEPPGESAEEQEVRVYSLATTVNECIVFLEEINGNRLLPIWIGLSEGQAIAVRFSGSALPRPLTHDVLLHIVRALGWTVEKVVVDDLREDTFYAKIHLKNDSSGCIVDSRPSDAIAVAVRAGCSIYVEEKVFASCQVLNKPITEEEAQKFREELKRLRPEDVFKELGRERPEEEGEAEA